MLDCSCGIFEIWSNCIHICSNLYRISYPFKTVDLNAPGPTSHALFFSTEFRKDFGRRIFILKFASISVLDFIIPLCTASFSHLIELTVMKRRFIVVTILNLKLMIERATDSVNVSRVGSVVCRKRGEERLRLFA